MPRDQFVLSFSFTGLLVALLCIAGIVALVVLIQVLLKAGKIVSALSNVVEDNKKELDATLKELPELAANIKSTTASANQLLDANNANISESISAAKTTLVNASRISGDAADGFEYVATSIVDTADSLTSGLSESASKLGYIREIVDIVRSIIR